MRIASLRWLLLGLLALAALAPAQASASFGFLPSTEGFDASLSEQNGAIDSLSGTHPYAFHVSIGLRAAAGFSDGDLRDLHLELPPGLLVNPTALSECLPADFHTPRSSPFEQSESGESCPNATQVGVAAVTSTRNGGATRRFGVFNLVPPYGAPGAIGLAPYGVPIVLTSHVRETDAGLSFELRNLPQSFDLQRLELTLWGTPWSSAHDDQRGNCLNEQSGGSFGKCLALGAANAPFEQIHSFLALPTAPCAAPLSFAVAAGSWQGAAAGAGVQSHDSEGHPVNLQQCNRSLSIAKLQLRSAAATVGTGLLFSLDVNDGGGILNPKGIARPAIRTALVTLPEGLTINPSVAAGLGTCSPAQWAREGVDTAPGAGCPNNSKVGEVRVDGMLGLPHPLEGSLYVASPRENPFGALIGLYMVARDPARGMLVKSRGRLEPDPHNGRLLASFEDLPRLLYTHYQLSLREGQRPMLVSPPACGLYSTDIAMSSWDAADALAHETSVLPISTGPGGGACPAPGPPAFTPRLQAGSLNANAGSYAPFYLHMTRTDPEQEITSYSATFPPGLLGKIAGVPYCPDAMIAAARGRSATQEIAAPSCPAASRIGHTLAGYGVGGVLAYAPGQLYLAGPYHGAPLSTVAIDAAQVGPFDLGTVVVRSAVRIDRRTAQVGIDSAGSDPIPHILDGIPLHLRDIRVYVDRPDFTLNPTNCDPLSTLSTLGGAGANPFNPGDDITATSSDRYQLLNCAALAFKPRIRFKLTGGTARGQHPALRATVTERPGDSNIKTAVVALPSTEFFAQNNIREICQTRQFEADRCPPTSIYGHARAFSPLLGEPLEGPVYLKTSAHPLPDMVAALRGDGGIAIDVEGRINSSHGGMRASFEVLPDAPASKFVLNLEGGKRKGLLENSENLCASPAYAVARLVGRDHSAETLKVKMNDECPKHRGAHRRHRR